MSYDYLCKLLAEKHPNSFADWLIGEESNDTQILKTELSIEQIRANSCRLEARTIYPKLEW